MCEPVCARSPAGAFAAARAARRSTALDGGLGEELRFDEPCAHRLHVGVRVMASKVRQPVDGTLTGTAQAREQLPGQRRGMRCDALGLGEHPGGLARGIEEAIRRLDREFPPCKAPFRAGAAR